MSFKRKIVSAVTSAFAVVAFSTFVSAQDNSAQTDRNSDQKQQKREWGGKGEKRGGFGKGMRGGRGGAMHALRGIELTDAQKEQIRSIMTANRPDEASMQEMRTLIQAKRAGTLTPEQQERFNVVREQARLRAEQTHQQVLAVLTAEQRQQLEQKKEQMRQKREERRQLRQQNRQLPQTDNTNDN